MDCAWCSEKLPLTADGKPDPAVYRPWPIGYTNNGLLLCRGCSSHTIAWATGNVTEEQHAEHKRACWSEREKKGLSCWLTNYLTSDTDPWLPFHQDEK